MLTKDDAAQLRDKDLDVLFLLFKNPELEELLSDGDTIRHVFVLAQEVFVRKFSNRPIEITDAKCWCIDQTNCINDKEVLWRIIKNFGHFIPKLMLRFSETVNLTEITEVNELINAYCGDTLNELEIVSSVVYVFDGMTKPFTQLETLTLNSDFIRFASSSLTFSELLFPRLAVLHVDKIHMDYPNALGYAFPYLQHVSVRCFNLNIPNHLTGEHFLELLKKNPQIHSLTLNNVNRTLLTIINGILPNLEGLELQSYQPSDNFDAGEMIVFENVKEFKMMSSSVSAPRNIEFPNLITFYTLGSAFFCNRWVELVEKAPKLENCFVKTDRVYSGQIGRLAEATSNLIQVIVKIVASNIDPVLAEEMVKLVRNNGNLRRMYLTASFKGKLNPTDLAVQLLFDEFEDKYDISSSRVALLVELPQ